MKIIIADDSKTSRLYILKTLLIGGVKESDILMVSNGQEALTALQKKDVSLVFLDIMMPVMDGMEVVKEVMKQGLLSGSRIIITSSLADPARMAILKESGVLNFLKKPFTPEGLNSIYQLLPKESPQ